MARLEDKTIITQELNATNKPVSRFFESDFRDAIIKHGLEVIHERAIKCPCKSRNREALSDCKNCGGASYFFVNPTKTRMVIQAMSLNPKFESWGVYGAEISSVTALPEDKLSYMDKITTIGVISEHSEVLHPLTWSDGTYYAYTVYNILDVYYVGVFVGAGEKLLKLESPQYSFINGNKIIIDRSTLPVGLQTGDLSFTIRYSHNPAYYIQEMVRDSMLVRINKTRAVEQMVQMPINARAKRIDLFKDRENFTGDRLLDNSFKVCDNKTAKKC